MSKQERFLCLMLLAVFTSTIYGLSAKANRSAVVHPSATAIKQGLLSSWSCSRPFPAEDLGIRFVVGDDGKIYEPEIWRRTSDIQFDAECVEAISNLSPVTAYTTGTSGLLHMSVSFGQRDKIDGINDPQYHGSDVKEYLKTHPQPADLHYGFVVIHKIPLSVLTRYPGLFTKDELLNPKNLFEMKADALCKDDLAFVRRIADHGAYWGELFKQEGVTKQMILDQAVRDRM